MPFQNVPLSIWPDRGPEEQADRRRALLPVPERDLSEADLGRKSAQSDPTGGDQRERRKSQYSNTSRLNAVSPSRPNGTTENEKCNFSSLIIPKLAFDCQLVNKRIEIRWRYTSMTAMVDTLILAI